MLHCTSAAEIALVFTFHIEIEAASSNIHEEAVFPVDFVFAATPGTIKLSICTNME